MIVSICVHLVLLVTVLVSLMILLEGISLVSCSEDLENSHDLHGCSIAGQLRGWTPHAMDRMSDGSTDTRVRFVTLEAGSYLQTPITADG